MYQRKLLVFDIFGDCPDWLWILNSRFFFLCGLLSWVFQVDIGNIFKKMYHHLILILFKTWKHFLGASGSTRGQLHLEPWGLWMWLFPLLWHFCVRDNGARILPLAAGGAGQACAALNSPAVQDALFSGLLWCILHWFFLILSLVHHWHMVPPALRLREPQPIVLEAHTWGRDLI